MSILRITAQRPIIAIGILLIVMVGFLGVWRVQAVWMERDFVDALRGGRVASLPIGLQGKYWSEAELAGVEAFHLDGGYGVERAIIRLIHTRGEPTISQSRYCYQATIKEESTGVRHVFGYRRASPGGWEYVWIHPDSTTLYIQQHVRNHPAP